jgi:hypothetical protein
MTSPVVFLTTLLGALLSVAPPTTSQVSDPIATPIPKRGLRVEIRDVARLPDTRKLRASAEDTAPAAWARVANILDGSVKDEFTYIHRAGNGELFLSSRQDGWIRTLAAADPPAGPSAQR